MTKNSFSSQNCNTPISHSKNKNQYQYQNLKICKLVKQKVIDLTNDLKNNNIKT